jgi:DNA-directed RNA polymerase specialized sigma24 family protein
VDHRKAKSSPFFLNSIDRLGRDIDADVLAAAQEIGRRAISKAEKILDDPATALNLLEEMAATVSRTLRERKTAGKPPITDLKGYLFLAFIRRVRREKRKQLVFDESSERGWEGPSPHMDQSAIERKLLLDELLASYDTATQDIILCRLNGLSWQEIETACGVTRDAAKKRFYKAIRRLQRVVQTRGEVT